ncbi:hypothetical protein ZYGR_0AZ00150 [Zygosaccharomyces rouxii]|uniref:Uncharacterized protein n=1 Tax=Zygosaccharomyces rouxii TaxID=4956 RepID=A0A1Q3AJE5_ZYGRO|nr:hypothetical protein ZYGR_0AZ00150 [Zygosaccharomyces rouxii]
MFEKRLQGLLLQEFPGGSALFFAHHILFFDFVGICGLDAAVVWFLRFWGVRLPFGCGVLALVQVYLALLFAGYYMAVHTSVCTQMNEKVLPEYLNMVSQGMDWRTIALATNELARKQGCQFHQIFYSSEQCCRYFARCIVKNVEKDQFNISVGDGEDVCMDRDLALNAVNAFKQSQELKQTQYQHSMI